jgi:hypothetical protein
MLFEVKALKVQASVSVERFANACQGGEGIRGSGGSWRQVRCRDLYRCRGQVMSQQR